LKKLLKFGIPQVILTDQDSNFLGEIFTNACNLLKVRSLISTAYHPQTIGALERTNRVVVEKDATFWKTNLIGTNGYLMLLLYATLHHTH
jgi:transposase InsO family protein